MNHFKTFLIEGRQAVFNQAIGHPHIAFDASGKALHQSYDERMDDLLSNTPRPNDEYHAKLHKILDQIEDGKSSVAPRTAQMGRIVANGGTFSDLQKFLPDMSPGAIPVHLNRLRKHIDDYHQTNIPAEQRVNLPAIQQSSKGKDFTLPGDASLEAILRHPKFKDDLDKLSRSEFYDKHLRQFHNEERSWSALTTMNSYDNLSTGSRYRQHRIQGVVAVKISKARRYHGIGNKNDDLERLSDKISRGHAIPNRITLRKLTQ